MDLSVHPVTDIPASAAHSVPPLIVLVEGNAALTLCAFVAVDKL